MVIGSHPRIAYVIDEFPPTDDRHLAEELVELERFGLEPNVFAVRKGLSWIAGRIAASGIEHLHAASAGPAARLASKVAHTTHTSYSFSVDGRYSSPGPAGRHDLTSLVRDAAFVVARSDAVRGRLAELCAPDTLVKVCRVYYGIDSTSLPFCEEQSRRADALLAVTGPVHDDVEDVLAAMASLARRRPSAQLTVLGPAGAEARIRREATRRGVAGVLTVICAPTEEIRQNLLRTHTLLVAPWTATAIPGEVPALFLEAMALGLPVVTSDIAGIREAIEDGWTGRLVAPGDPLWLAGAMETLLDNPRLRDRMGHAARERIERDFSSSRNAAMLAQLFDRRPAPLAAAGGGSRTRLKRVGRR
jgi:colanic acid/amylovoran biosynthesis glycosyltransferase